MKRPNPITLKDTLQNCARDSGATDDYAQGVVLGVVAGLMAAGTMNFNQAMSWVKPNLPANLRDNWCPPAWRK